jgi:hypothetical protein
LIKFDLGEESSAVFALEVFTVSGETGGTGRSCRSPNPIFYPLAHFSIGSGMVGFVPGLTGELHRYFLIVSGKRGIIFSHHGSGTLIRLSIGDSRRSEHPTLRQGQMTRTKKTVKATGKDLKRKHGRRFKTFDRVLTLIRLGLALKPWISWLIDRCHDRLD